MDKSMMKRAAGAYFVVALIMLLSIYRIISLTQSDYAKTGSAVSSRTITLASTRGKIYDCNGERLVDREYTRVGAVKPTASALIALQKILDNNTLSYAESSILDGYPISVALPYNPLDRDIYVYDVPVRYNDVAGHIIGYTDGSKGVSGIEKSFDSFLQENSGKLNVTFAVDAMGRVLAGAEPVVSNEGFDSVAGVKLTLDRDIQLCTQQALKDGNIESGAAVVLEIGTGAIKAMVSLPEFDQNDISNSLNADNSPLLNKALCSYAVGSVFKPFIAAAGIESGVNTKFTCVCEGSTDVNGTVFGCYGHKAHGNMDLGTALIKSCNVYFIGFSRLISHEYLISFCENFGFGSEISLADSIVSSSGTMPDTEAVKYSGDYANLSFGQGLLSATPLQLAGAYAALVSDGVYHYPYLTQGTIDTNGNYTEYKKKAPSKIMSEGTAEAMRKLLTAVVEKGDMNAKPFLTTAGGKTATAQSGIYDGGREICRTWFAGFFPADKPKYVVVVLKEDGNSGSRDCAPVFRNIVDAISQISS